MNPLYLTVAARAADRCEYCHAPEAAFNFPFEVEHIRPRSRGGTDDPENLALACSACNVYKGDGVTASDEVTGTEARLFHPREDRWENHFRVESDTLMIVGRTPTGRVTVARLRMNHERQLTARRRWATLGLFP